MSTPTALIALLEGPDRPGLVAGVSGWIASAGGNILHADQHSDAEAGIFFQRIAWTPGGNDPEAEAAGFQQYASGKLGMRASVFRTDVRPRVVLMVSGALHCAEDLIGRFRIGEFPAQLTGLLSNHEDAAPLAQANGLPFACIPVEKGARNSAERRQLEQLREWQPDLVVLARYMQILSGGFLARLGGPVINIHHSFLPAFAGGRPYHQAFERGVKLIGATAHYATAELDAGPIIAQDVTRVSHRHGVRDLVRLGRDLEKLVLAQAVRAHLERRVLTYGNKTVVFD